METIITKAIKLQEVLPDGTVRDAGQPVTVIEASFDLPSGKWSTSESHAVFLSSILGRYVKMDGILVILTTLEVVAGKRCSFTTQDVF